MRPLPRPKTASVATAAELMSFVTAYSELLATRWAAEDCRLPCNASAVPRSQLGERGIPDAILVWMMYQAHAEHLRPAPGGQPGWFVLRPAFSLHFGTASWFRLTDLGADFANDFLADVLVPESNESFARVWEELFLGTLVPSYDKENRIFTWGRHLVKWFRQPSFNQEVILAAGEEQGWPVWYDDPLPRRPRLNPKKLLRNTIKDLNRRQFASLIHFQGDGTGTRVGWVHR